MVVKQFELAIDLGTGGEWICEVTMHNENDVVRYEIEVDPPIFGDGPKSDPFPMEMRYNNDGSLVFHTGHPLTEDLKDLEAALAREIIDEVV